MTPHLRGNYPQIIRAFMQLIKRSAQCPILLQIDEWRSYQGWIDGLRRPYRCDDILLYCYFYNVAVYSFPKVRSSHSG